MASLALSAQHSKATIIELSMQQAAKIKGGDCAPSCVSGGTCNATPPQCGSGQLVAQGSSINEVHCDDAGSYCQNPTHSQCSGPVSVGTCNSSGGGNNSGCGTLFIQPCKYNVSINECQNNLPTAAGSCLPDCTQAN